MGIIYLGSLPNKYLEERKDALEEACKGKLSPVSKEDYLKVTKNLRGLYRTKEITLDSFMFPVKRFNVDYFSIITADNYFEHINSKNSMIEFELIESKKLSSESLENNNFNKAFLMLERENGINKKPIVSLENIIY